MATEHRKGIADMAKRKPSAGPQRHSRLLSKTRPRAPAKPTKGIVFQLKITLDDIRPPIWRRVQTKDCTLAKLHDIIQTVLSWEDYHLHEFEIGDRRFGLPEQWQDDFWEGEVSDSRKVKLSHLAEQGVKKFRYQYDMGDSWWHTIHIEKTVPPEAGVKYPRCIGGERAGPPEDSGGPWLYADFVDAVQNPDHERHEEVREWVGDDFDPEAFDVGAVNKQL
jgi:hypothetical protein